MNSRQEAEQEQRKITAEHIKQVVNEADPEDLRRFVDWVNRLIEDDDFFGEDDD